MYCMKAMRAKPTNLSLQPRDYVLQGPCAACIGMQSASDSLHYRQRLGQSRSDAPAGLKYLLLTRMNHTAVLCWMRHVPSRPTRNTLPLPS